MASGRDERALSRPSIPLADHSTSKPRSASSAAISSAVSLSSSIRSTFVIGSFSAAAKAFAPRPVLEPEFRGIICLLETKGIISTARKCHEKRAGRRRPPESGGRRRGGRRPLCGQSEHRLRGASAVGPLNKTHRLPERATPLNSILEMARPEALLASIALREGVGERVFGFEHDPEKWVPVFRKDHALIRR